MNEELIVSKDKGPFVQRPISANPGLNLIQVSLFLYSRAFLR